MFRVVTYPLMLLPGAFRSVGFPQAAIKSKLTIVMEIMYFISVFVKGYNKITTKFYNFPTLKRVVIEGTIYQF